MEQQKAGNAALTATKHIKNKTDGVVARDEFERTVTEILNASTLIIIQNKPTDSKKIAEEEQISEETLHEDHDAVDQIPDGRPSEDKENPEEHSAAFSSKEKSKIKAGDATEEEAEDTSEEEAVTTDKKRAEVPAKSRHPEERCAIFSRDAEETVKAKDQSEEEAGHDVKKQAKEKAEHEAENPQARVHSRKHGGAH